MECAVRHVGLCNAVSKHLNIFHMFDHLTYGVEGIDGAEVATATAKLLEVNSALTTLNLSGCKCLGARKGGVRGAMFCCV